MGSNNVDSMVSQRVLLAVFFGLLIISYRVLYPFFAPIAWAIILTHVTWPIYRTLRDWLGNQPAVSALLMTLFLGAFFVLPVIWLITLLHTELPAVYQAAAKYLAQGPQVIPESIARIPFLLVLIGVLGGIGTFGLVGMFLGPVVIAVLLAAWREWLEEQVPSAPDA